MDDQNLEFERVRIIGAPATLTVSDQYVVGQCGDHNVMIDLATEYGNAFDADQRSREEIDKQRELGRKEVLSRLHGLVQAERDQRNEQYRRRRQARRGF